MKSLSEQAPTNNLLVGTKHLHEKSRVKPLLPVRIMRACTASHIFTEVGEELYAHNAYSRIFSKEQNRDMFKQMYDFVGKGTYALPEHLEKTDWKNPENYNDSAFHLGQNTNLGFWEYLEAVPGRLETFNSGMRSMASVTAVASVYPFDVELNRDPVTANDVVLVDVGGGRGQVLEKIKNEFPGLRGVLVLQDQEEVIADAVSRSLPQFIRAQPASFFHVNPVKGARAYHFRRIFHDWSDSASIDILRNTVAAMTPTSRVLISDNDVPTQKAPAHMALQDLNMMSFAGMERTMKQWVALLDRAGLTIVKTWRVDGNDHVMIEARLRDSE